MVETRGKAMDYKVYTCGTTREFSAPSPEDAAAMMLRDRKWVGTGSILVMSKEVEIDFLNCKLVDGSFEYGDIEVLTGVHDPNSGGYLDFR